MKDRAFDLEERLIEFAVNVIQVSDSLPETRVGNHIRGQLLRCGTSAAPNYAEAQSAESREDFLHKIKIALKELRETKVWLRLIVRTRLLTSLVAVKPLIQENDELIAIFVASVKTALSRSGKSPPHGS
jgi:four helix bundle protein